MGADAGLISASGERPLPDSALTSKCAVALLRPIDEARKSAAALEARGYKPVVAPVTRIVGTGAQLPEGDFDAVVATSARVFTFLSADVRGRLAPVPLFAVGESTAAAARNCGLRGEQVIAPDRRSLIPALLARLSNKGRLLYLAGHFRKYEIEAILAAAGVNLALVELYRAEATGGWSGAEAEAMRGCAAALHYSRRSAGLACEFAERAGVGAHFREMSHICLSRDVAVPLRAFRASAIVVANHPREDALFTALQGVAEKA
jgi:uroporphyrinogen-III synthase